MSAAETIDQYELLKRTFDALGVEYEEWDSPPSAYAPATWNGQDTRRHVQSIDLKDSNIEFWFSDGNYSHVAEG